MKLFFVTALTLLGTLCYSQDGKIFKGSYNVNKSKSRMGIAPDYVMPVAYDIKPEKGYIAILRKMVNEDGSKKDITEDMKFDGSPYKREVASGNASSSLTWINDSSFKVEKEWTDKEGKVRMKSTETWTTEDGGKTLKVNYDVEQADGNNYSIVGVFEKN